MLSEHQQEALTTFVHMAKVVEHLFAKEMAIILSRPGLTLILPPTNSDTRLFSVVAEAMLKELGEVWDEMRDDPDVADHPDVIAIGAQLRAINSRMEMGEYHAS